MAKRYCIRQTSLADKDLQFAVDIQNVDKVRYILGQRSEVNTRTAIPSQNAIDFAFRCSLATENIPLVESFFMSNCQPDEFLLNQMLKVYAENGINIFHSLIYVYLVIFYKDLSHRLFSFFNLLLSLPSWHLYFVTTNLCEK